MKNSNLWPMLKNSANPMVGICRLIRRASNYNCHAIAIRGVIKLIKANCIDVILRELVLHQVKCFHLRMVNNLGAFKQQASVFIANRQIDALCDVADKLQTRDLFLKY